MGAVTRETVASGNLGMHRVVATERHTLSAAATSSSSISIPTNAIILGVSGIVTTAVTGPAASFTIGDGTDADRFGTGIAIAANTTFGMSDWTAGGLNGTAHAAKVVLNAAWNIVFTGTGANFTGGVIDLAVIYEVPDELTAALPVGS